MRASSRDLRTEDSARTSSLMRGAVARQYRKPARDPAPSLEPRDPRRERIQPRRSASRPHRHSASASEVVIQRPRPDLRSRSRMGSRSRLSRSDRRRVGSGTGEGPWPPALRFVAPAAMGPTAARSSADIWNQQAFVMPASEARETVFANTRITVRGWSDPRTRSGLLQRCGPSRFAVSTRGRGVPVRSPTVGAPRKTRASRGPREESIPSWLAAHAIIGGLPAR